MNPVHGRRIRVLNCSNCPALTASANTASGFACGVDEETTVARYPHPLPKRCPLKRQPVLLQLESN